MHSQVNVSELLTLSDKPTVLLPLYYLVINEQWSKIKYFVPPVSQWESLKPKIKGPNRNVRMEMANTVIFSTI